MTTNIVANLFDYDHYPAQRDQYISKTEFIKIKPVEIADIDARVFTFQLATSDLYMYDLQNVMLSAFTSIASRERGDLGVASKLNDATKDFDPVTFSNLMLDCCFDKVTVMFNDHPVCVTSLHPFRAFVEKSLSYSEAAKNSTIASQFYFKDYTESLDMLKSTAMAVKSSFTEKSAEVYISTKLCNDAFNIVPYMPGSVKISVQLQRSSNAFSLLVDTTRLEQAAKLKVDQYYVRLRNLQLSCKRLLLTDAGRAFVSHRLQRPLHFTFPAMKLHTVLLPGQVLSWESSLSLTRLPSRLFVGLVETDCVYGNYTKNSLYFKHFNLSSLVLKRDSLEVDSLKIDSWTVNGTKDIYNRFLYALKITNTLNSLDVTPEAYRNGPLTLFPLLGANDITEVYPHPDGLITLGFKFSAPLPKKGLTAIVFSLVQSELTVTNMDVTLDNVVGY